jgi:hypothetical protein
MTARGSRDHKRLTNMPSDINYSEREWVIYWVAADKGERACLYWQERGTSGEWVEALDDATGYCPAIHAIETAGAVKLTMGVNYINVGTAERLRPHDPRCETSDLDPEPPPVGA